MLCVLLCVCVGVCCFCVCFFRFSLFGAWFVVILVVWFLFFLCDVLTCCLNVCQFFVFGRSLVLGLRYV